MRAVEGRDGSDGLVARVVAHKAAALALAAGVVQDKDLLHVAVRAEQRAQVLLGRGLADHADEQLVLCSKSQTNQPRTS